MLLKSKSVLREQVAGEVIARPAERRTKLVHMNHMIDDAIALMNEHYKHCTCQSTGSVAQANLSSPGESRPRRQSRTPLNGFSGLVRS